MVKLFNLVDNYHRFKETCCNCLQSRRINHTRKGCRIQGKVGQELGVWMGVLKILLNHAFYHICYDLLWLVLMNQVGKPTSTTPTIAQITLSSVQLRVSLSGVDSLHAVQNEGFSSTIYCILHKQKCLLAPCSVRILMTFMLFWGY